MRVKIKATLAVLALGLFANAQNSSVNSSTEPVTRPRTCGTDLPPAGWDAWFNSRVEKYKLEMATGRTQATSITIPVIVHVIHGGQNVGTFPNISVNQIRSQITVMNNDFAGKGYNSGQLASTGFSVVGAANTNITFCLAQVDPNGNQLATPGIDRVNYVTMGWTNPYTPNTLAAFKTLMDGTIKPNTIWDPTQYFNIWVSDVNPNCYILGYATFPAGANLSGLPSGGDGFTDGIWVWAKSFGNTGILDPTYSKGRTAVHETGHWLGLRHIGGDAANASGDCNATDYCDDTPPQMGGFASGTNGQNFGAPTYPLHVNVCGSPYGDMFMNFMDYTNDPICYMFTPDQNIRIQTAMTDGFYRNQLSASSATQCVGMPFADYILDTVGCTASDIIPLNQTNGNPNPTYSWTAEPSLGVSFAPNTSVGNPTINFNSPGYYTITVVTSNSIGISSMTTAMNISACEGIRDLNDFERNISVAPNPSSGMIQIKTALSENKNFEIVIHNSVGELVFRQTFANVAVSTQTIDLSSYPGGMYFVTCTGDHEKAVKKLVINR